MNKPCVHRGEYAGTYNLGGQAIEAFDCERFNDHCTDTAGTPLRCCVGCCEFDEHPRPTVYLSCALRGEDTGDRVNCGCQVDRAIYSCRKNGRCVKRLPAGYRPEASTDGVTECATCADATETVMPSAYADPPKPVAVVITSHNYGRFLQESIESVLAQIGRPAEIIVVDDSSTDDTPLVAGDFAAKGVRYQRVDVRSVFLARAAGLAATKSEFVVFLDADDALAPGYLTECLAVMEQDERIGVVTSDLQCFGTSTDRLHHVPRNLEQSNWIHAGSMCRRAALDMSGVYQLRDGPTLLAHDDWFVWKRLDRLGWKFASTGLPSYLYRRHPDSMLHGEMRNQSYYIRAAINLEPVTLIVPLCRERYWDRLFQWIIRQPEITDLLLIDSSDSDDFRTAVRWTLAGLKRHSVRFVDRPGSARLADADRARRPEVYYAVQKVMPQIYRYAAEATTEFLMVVEDDVLPPDGAITALLEGMDHDVAGVTGTVPSRYQPGQSLSGSTFDSTLPLDVARTDLQDVAFSGFGCLALRRSAVRDCGPFHAGGTGNYDIEFCRTAKKRGWRWRQNWSVRCQHAELNPWSVG